MGPAPDALSFFTILESIKEPRVERSRLHPLPSILLLCLCAVLAGCTSVVEIADFGEDNREFFEAIAPLPNGMPSHDTICRVLAKGPFKNHSAIASAFVDAGFVAKPCSTPVQLRFRASPAPTNLRRDHQAILERALNLIPASLRDFSSIGCVCLHKQLPDA